MPHVPATLLVMLAYLAAAGWLAQPLLRRGRAQGFSWPAGALALLAVVGHGGLLFGMHRGALDLHFFAALSLVGWMMALLALLFQPRRRLAALGIVVFPLAALLLGIDAFLAPPTAPLALSWQITLHVSLSLLAYATLSIAAILAGLLAVQERALRHRPVGAWLRVLPPLTLTEQLLFRTIGIGFVLLSLSLVTGGLFVDDLFAQHLAHKTVLSIVAWLVFGVLLLGRWRRGWRGRHAIHLTLWGMAFLLLAFFGTKFVLELVLRRG